MREQDHSEPAPAVIGADWMAEQYGEQPTLAYVPSERVLEGDTDVTVRMLRLEDGRTVILAFTSLDGLVGGMGTLQPWVALTADRVAEMQSASGADEVLWDPEVPAELRQEAN